jgi:hypothetical protein
MKGKRIRVLFPGLPWEEHVLRIYGMVYKIYYASTRKALYCYFGGNLMVLPPVL